MARRRIWSNRGAGGRRPLPRRDPAHRGRRRERRPILGPLMGRSKRSFVDREGLRCLRAGFVGTADRQQQLGKFVSQESHAGMGMIAALHPSLDCLAEQRLGFRPSAGVAQNLRKTGLPVGDPAVVTAELQFADADGLAKCGLRVFEPTGSRQKICELVQPVCEDGALAAGSPARRFALPRGRAPRPRRSARYPSARRRGCSAAWPPGCGRGRAPSLRFRSRVDRAARPRDNGGCST